MSGSFSIPQAHRHGTPVLHGLPSLRVSQLQLKGSLLLCLPFHWLSVQTEGGGRVKNPWERQALGKGFRRQELCGAPEILEHSCLPDLSTVLPSVNPTERLFSRNPDFKTSLGLFSSRFSQIPCFSVASQQRLPCLPLPHPRPVLPFTSPAHGPPGLALPSGTTLPGGAASLAQLALCKLSFESCKSFCRPALADGSCSCPGTPLVRPGFTT